MLTNDVSIFTSLTIRAVYPVAILTSVTIICIPAESQSGLICIFTSTSPPEVQPEAFDMDYLPF